MDQTKLNESLLAQAEAGNLQVVKFLVEQGADVNSKNTTRMGNC